MKLVGSIRLLKSTSKVSLVIFTLVVSMVAGGYSNQVHANDEQVDLNRQALAAARSGNAKTFKSFIELGASPNTRNRVGDSLLMTSIKSGQMEIMLLLLERGADVNLANVAQVTPLMTAAFYGRPAMARILIDKKANVNAVDQMQKSAIVYAAGTGQTEIVNMLLKTGPASGITPNTRYPNGLTALMWAGASGHLPTVQALLDQGADASLVDNRGKTVLQMADENGQLEVVKFLRSR
ncbi:ankyrin repeat domain-containing protein [Glaciimonas sp. PAMC28666]|uniref:ankyrin repeat domain-containing protein n=1 Tax=Glaciimonas sp. PAMC28666 TaxID=2807626 RepID=UPI0019643D7B|nr:ankyrin repeat domain-containing protein [Glaciimonas sp. PAMC28666]QRX84553.1 ankyrin repeat domain-containing protein [Glaciimonas sp. PAMC28666]